MDEPELKTEDPKPRALTDAELKTFRDQLKTRYGIEMDDPVPEGLADLIRRLNDVKAKHRSFPK